MSAGRVTESKAVSEPATAVVPENSQSMKTDHTIEEATASQKATGKRSSPGAFSEDQGAIITDLSNKPKEDDQGSELHNSTNGSPPKKQYLDQSACMVDLEAALRQAGDTKSSIEKIIQIYKDGVGDAFTSHLCHPEAKRSDKYKDRSSIVVPESSDPWIRMALGYMRLDFENIKALIAEPVLDKGALVFKINESIASWEMLLQDRAIPKEATALICELKDLHRNLTADTEHVIPFSISALRGDEEHIQDHVNIGDNSYGSANLALDSLKDWGSIWDKHIEQVKEKKRQHLSKIKELENAIRFARSELSKEQEREASIVQSRTQYARMVTEASKAISNFEVLIAQGKTCLKSIQTSIHAAGSQGGSNLPAELQAQLQFLESCKVEKAE